MSDPKDIIKREWGVGEMADGSINIFDASELAARQAQRDAEERAFAEMLDKTRTPPTPMTITKIDYCSWDDDPALLVSFDDGRIHGYWHPERSGWRMGHAADIAMNAAVLTEKEFADIWPGLQLPEAIRTELASSKRHATGRRQGMRGR